MPTITRGPVTSKDPFEHTEHPDPVTVPELSDDEKTAREVVGGGNRLSASLTEAEATRRGMANMIEKTDAGPIIHVPKTVKDHTRIANEQSLEESKTTSVEGGFVAREEGPRKEVAYHRIYSQDGPINTNERIGFDPLQPDFVSTDASLAGPEVR